VKESVKVLRYGDLTTFGRLLNTSHHSLKEEYEVTGIELDTLAETAQQVKGCLGARMTGAGFGGCAIALVHRQAINEFKQVVGERYSKVIGRECSFYETQIGDGVRLLS
jgi:galactokinase